jgi:hypothetical protein
MGSYGHFGLYCDSTLSSLYTAAAREKFSRVTSGMRPCPKTSVASSISIPTSFSSGPMFSAISSFSLTVRHSCLPSISRIYASNRYCDSPGRVGEGPADWQEIVLIPNVPCKGYSTYIGKTYLFITFGRVDALLFRLYGRFFLGLSSLKTERQFTAPSSIGHTRRDKT